jgi:hypothetical protein
VAFRDQPPEGATAGRHIWADATLRIRCGRPHLMRESRSSGSVEGVVGNHDPYSDRNAGVGVSRVPTIVVRIASPDRSDRLVTSLANLALRQPRSGPRNRPHKACQLARHRHTDLIDLHPACTQPGEARGERQLCLPGHVADGLRQFFGSTLRSITDARLKAVVPRRLNQQPSRVPIASLGDAAACHLFAAGVLAGTKPRYAISWRGCTKRLMSPISATKPIALI